MELVYSFKDGRVLYESHDDISDKDLRIKITREKMNRLYSRPHGYSWYYINDEFILKSDLDGSLYDNTQENISEKIIEIERWLSENDWIINKVFLGEWDSSDPRYLKYLEERSDKRKEHARLSELNI